MKKSTKRCIYTFSGDVGALRFIIQLRQYNLNLDSLLKRI